MGQATESLLLLGTAHQTRSAIGPQPPKQAGGEWAAIAGKGANFDSPLKALLLHVS